MSEHAANGCPCGGEHRAEYTVTPDAVYPQRDARLFPQDIAETVHASPSHFGEKKAWVRVVCVPRWTPYEPS